MKRYKLYGEMWDKIPEKDLKIKNISNENVLMYNEGYNLLDYNQPYIRQINITTLLNSEKETFYNNIIKNLKLCDTVIVNLDYYPSENNPIVFDFYNRRISQVNYLLCANLRKKCSVKFCRN